MMGRLFNTWIIRVSSLVLFNFTLRAGAFIGRLNDVIKSNEAKTSGNYAVMTRTQKLVSCLKKRKKLNEII